MITKTNLMVKMLARPDIQALIPGKSPGIRRRHRERNTHLDITVESCGSRARPCMYMKNKQGNKAVSPLAVSRL
jgi:hypothetical protein